jgi:(3S)-linalool synthase
MAAAPARIVFSSTVEPRLHLQAASPAAGNGRRGHRRRGGSIIICSSLVASETLLLRADFDLEEGLTNMQKILQQRRKSGREMMAAVDNLKRLCIDHYFEEEIETAMGGACMDLVHSDDLWDATLAFRLMREAGHHVSAGQ